MEDRPIIRFVLAAAAATCIATSGSEEALADQPTPAQIAWAREVAVAYWQVPQPPCGRETVGFEPLPPSEAGMAYWGTCHIGLSTSAPYHLVPQDLCRVYVHEFGHLVLGPDAFASTNSRDPAHSADPLSVMYAGAVSPDQYSSVLGQVGCSVVPQALDPQRLELERSVAAAAAEARPRAKHRRRRHRRHR